MSSHPNYAMTRKHVYNDMHTQWLQFDLSCCLRFDVHIKLNYTLLKQCLVALACVYILRYLGSCTSVTLIFCVLIVYLGMRPD